MSANLPVIERFEAVNAALAAPTDTLLAAHRRPLALDAVLAEEAGRRCSMHP